MELTFALSHHFLFLHKSIGAVYTFCVMQTHTDETSFFFLFCCCLECIPKLITSVLVSVSSSTMNFMYRHIRINGSMKFIL